MRQDPLSRFVAVEQARVGAALAVALAARKYLCQREQPRYLRDEGRELQYSHTTS